MTKFGTYQGSVGNKAGLAGHITYSGGFYNQDFFRNTSGFLSELERRRMELSFDSTFKIRRDNYISVFSWQPRDVRKDYEDPPIGRQLGIEAMADALAVGNLPFFGDGSGMFERSFDRSSPSRGIIGGYDAWHTNFSGDYQNTGQRVNKENHYKRSETTTSGFSQELPYTRSGGLTNTSGGLESKFIGYM